MINLRVKQTIIKLYLEGISQREIARMTKKSRNTVSKYIKEYEVSRKEDIRNLPIAEDILKPPIYKKRINRKRVLSEEIQTVLKGYIKENEWKRKNYMSKQQMKIIDMHEKLMDAGYSISYTTVRNFVNEYTAKTKEVFIRRYCEPGYEVEFDWGEVKLEVDGNIKSYSLAVFTLAHSNYRFARLYQSESQVCVLDVHTKIIDHVGFIPAVFTYDNPFQTFISIRIRLLCYFPAKKSVHTSHSLPSSLSLLSLLSITLPSALKFFPKTPIFALFFSVLDCIEYSDNIIKFVPRAEKRIRRKDEKRSHFGMVLLLGNKLNRDWKFYGFL